MECVIYARQSVGDKEISASVNEQIEQCNVYAKAKDWIVKDIFSDKNTSGATYPKGSESFARQDLEWHEYLKTNDHANDSPYRAGLQKALKAVTGCEILLVYDITRLYRPVPSTFIENHIQQLLKQSGAMLHAVHEGELDFSKFDTRLIQMIKSQVEHESKELKRDRAAKAIRDRLSLGYTFGKTRFGYKRIGVQKIEIAPIEAEVVKDIYERYIAGESINGIGRELYSNKTYSRGGEWTGSLVKKILSYCGYIGKYKRKDGQVIQSKVYPSIISEEMFFKVQDRMKGNKLLGRKTKLQHYVKKMLFCGTCGHPMNLHRQSSLAVNPKHFFFCIHNTFGITRDEGCTHAAAVEWSNFERGNPKLPPPFGVADSVYPLMLLLAEKYYLESDLVALNAERRIAIENEIAKLRNKTQESRNQWKADLIDIDTHNADLKEFNNKIKELEKVLSGIVQTRTQATAEKLEIYTRLYKQIITRTLEPQMVESLLHDAIKRINLFPLNIEVVLWNGKSFEIERIPRTSARVFPDWKIEKEWEQGPTTHPYDREVIKYLYHSAYKGDKTERTVYEDQYIIIKVLGSNPRSRKYVTGKGYVPVDF